MSAGSGQVPGHEAILERARAVKNAHQRRLLAMANVVGVGVGYAQQGKQLTSQVAIIVLVNRKLPNTMLAPQDTIPPEIDGVLVDVQEVGFIKAD